MFSFLFVHTDTSIDFDLPKNPDSSRHPWYVKVQNMNFPFSRCKIFFTTSASLLTLSHEGTSYEVSFPDTVITISYLKVFLWKCENIISKSR